MLAEPAVDHGELVLDAYFGLVVLDEVLVEQHERDDFGHAGHDGEQHPDNRIAEVAGHLPQNGQLSFDPLEGWRQFLLQALPPGLLPRHGGRRVEELEPARVVISHAAHELVEDVEPVDPEGEYGPAQRRPVAEDVVRLAPPLRCQADALGSGTSAAGRASPEGPQAEPGWLAARTGSGSGACRGSSLIDGDHLCYRRAIRTGRERSLLVTM